MRDKAVDALIADYVKLSPGPLTVTLLSLGYKQTKANSATS